VLPCGDTAAGFAAHMHCHAACAQPDDAACLLTSTCLCCCINLMCVLTCVMCLCAAECTLGLLCVGLLGAGCCRVCVLGLASCVCLVVPCVCVL
jgi:hypothetical protein